MNISFGFFKLGVSESHLYKRMWVTIETSSSNKMLKHSIDANEKENLERLCIYWISRHTEITLIHQSIRKVINNYEVRYQVTEKYEYLDKDNTIMDSNHLNLTLTEQNVRDIWITPFKAYTGGIV